MMAHFGDVIEEAQRTYARLNPTTPQVVILCGGRGERMGGMTLEKPKPMLEVGGRPILWHILRHFEAHGFSEFLLALGYLGWVVDSYFSDPESNTSERVVRRINTGWDTQSAGRIKRLAPYLDETFLLAWCDGLTNLDLSAMLAFHRAHGKLCTVATVHPQSRFGELVLQGDRVASFTEKPIGTGWINAGFFVCEPGVQDYIGGDIAPDKMQWERQPMERLATDGQLMAFRHEGFWACMDTEKDQRELNDQWRNDHAPWAKK